MTKVQHILREISELDANDQETLLQEILKRVDRKKRAKAILNRYRGIGKGIWNADAQEYINSERAQDQVKL
ncbi:hypothetical protein [Tunicatimonas pelagia]|uniref:hypothetical protein n=1 Tax=Tunicatimonas pelagia TaxID=931531 RepID=UPI0026652C95|nr:hypothetical protein [Tunicatimonas pelagia]WKN41277.1 hypothetical protein P0M28_19765 [Tunicatimonas pelagia]